MPCLAQIHVFLRRLKAQYSALCFHRLTAGINSRFLGRCALGGVCATCGQRGGRQNPPSTSLRQGPMTTSSGIQAAGRPLRVRSSIRPSRASRLSFESEVNAISVPSSRAL